jgi:hypothetical protein
MFEEEKTSFFLLVLYAVPSLFLIISAIFYLVVELLFEGKLDL